MTTDAEAPDLHQRFDDALAELPEHQRAFVMEYLRDLNGTKAAIRAKYAPGSAAVQASRLIRNAKVRTAVRAGLAMQAMATDEILFRLSGHARGSMGDFLRVDPEPVTIDMHIAVLTDAERVTLALQGGDSVRRLLAQVPPVSVDDESADLPKAVLIQTATITRSAVRLDLLNAGDKLHLIKKYTVDKDGKETIELYDAQTALTTLGKHHRLFVERQEHTGPGGGPVPVSFVTVLAEPMPESDDDTDDESDLET